MIRVAGLVGKCCNEVRLRNYFIPFGPIETVVLAKEGVATVQFKYAADAVEAMNNANGAEFKVLVGTDGETKSILQVSLAKPSLSHSKDQRVVRQQAVWANSGT